MEDFDCAEEALQHLVDIWPANPHGHVDLSRVLQARGRTDLAIAELRAAIRLAPEQSNPHLELARLLQQKDETASALHEAKEAVRLDDNSGEAHAYLGYLLYTKAEYDAALAQCRTALRRPRHTPTAHVCVGVTLVAQATQKQSDELLAQGIDSFRNAVREDPGNGAIHLMLAQALGHRQECEALPEYRLAIKLSPDDADAHEAFARVLLSLYVSKQILDEQAKRILKAFGSEGKVEFTGPDCSPRNADEIIQELKQVLRIAPGNTASRVSLSEILMQTGDFALAQKVLAQGLAIDPKSAALYHQMGDLLKRNGDLKGAAEHLALAVSLEPGNDHFVEARKELEKELSAKN